MKGLRRNDLADGLRATALLAVIAYHWQIDILPAAHLGVQIFFVLAGYYSVRQWNMRNPDQRFRKAVASYPGLLRKRMERLYTPLLACLSALLLVTRLTQTDVFLELKKMVPSVLTATANHYQAAQSQSYFMAALGLNPGVHFWALSLEICFYLLAPIFLILIPKGRRPLLAILAVGSSVYLGLQAWQQLLNPEQVLRYRTALSTAWAQGQWADLTQALWNAWSSPTAVDASPLYYSGLARMSAFLFGMMGGQSLDRSRWPKRRNLKPGTRLLLYGTALLLTALSLAVMALPSMGLNRLMPYTGGFSLYALFIALLLMCLDAIAELERAHIHRSCFAHVLGNPLTRFLAGRSYSYYLWQFPIQILLRQFLADYSLPRWQSKGLEITALLIVGEITYRFFENHSWIHLRSRLGQCFKQGLLGPLPVLVLVLSLTWALPAPASARRVLNEADILAKMTALNEQQDARKQQAQQSGKGKDPSRDPKINPSEQHPLARQMASRLPAWVKPIPPKAAEGPERYIQKLQNRTTSANLLNLKGETPKNDPGNIALRAAETAKAMAEAERRLEDEKAASSENGIPLPRPHFGLSEEEFARIDAHPITLIGDSVLAMTAQQITAAFPKAVLDAKVSRHLTEGVEVVRAMAASGSLGDAVVLALGTNGDIRPDLLQEVRNLIGDRPLLLVNISVPRDYEESNNQILKAYCDSDERAYLVDWNGLSKTHREYFYQDGYHPVPEAAHLYNELILRKLLEALP